MPKVSPKILEKAIKNLNKMIKDLESGKFEKYGLKNPEEAKAFADYLKEKVEQFKRALERAKAK